MWILEAAGALLALLLLTGWPAIRSASLRKWLPAALVGIFLILLLFDPLRWQIIPLHLLILTGLTVGAYRTVKGPVNRPFWARGLIVVSGLLWLVVAAVPLFLMPVFDLPRPRGPLPVGVTEFEVRDTARPDPFFGGNRAFMVKAWYPASVRDRPVAAYVSSAFTRALIFNPEPFLVFGHLSLIGTASQDNAVPASGQHPVLIFVPGYYSYNSQSTALAQDLASHGYIVLAIGPPGDALAVEMSDGEIRRFKRHEFLKQAAGAPFPLGLDAPDSLSPDDIVTMARRIRSEIPAAQDAMKLQVGDVRFLLDRLSANALPRLKGHMDKQRIGVMGMSFGGSVAGQACYQDTRCKAGANLDGFQFGDFHGREMGKPFLMLASEEVKTWFLNDMMYRAPIRPPGAPALINLRIRGSRHLDVSDMTLSSPFAKRFIRNGVLGTIPGERMIGATSDAVTGFFDEYLLGRPGAQMRALDTWPEVIIRKPRLPQGWQN